MLYQRLSINEREEISRLVSNGISYRAIANQLGRSPSTIGREVQAGGTTRHTYRAHRAARRALRNASKRKCGHTKLTKDPRLQKEVVRLLTHFFSPEQIARMLERMYPNDDTMRIAPETIYTYLYVLPRGSLRQELMQCLRHGHAWRHKRTNPRNRGHMGTIPDMISIDERPIEVANRTIPGHWEGDLIVGINHQSALGTLVERTTGRYCWYHSKLRQLQTCGEPLLVRFVAFRLTYARVSPMTGAGRWLNTVSLPKRPR